LEPGRNKKGGIEGVLFKGLGGFSKRKRGFLFWRNFIDFGAILLGKNLLDGWEIKDAEEIYFIRKSLAIPYELKLG